MDRRDPAGIVIALSRRLHYEGNPEKPGVPAFSKGQARHATIGKPLCFAIGWTEPQWVPSGFIYLESIPSLLFGVAVILLRDKLIASRYLCKEI